MKIVSYCRVSTDEQASQGVSLDAQQAKIAAYCDLYELVIVETCVDPGESGKSLKRPGLQRALELLRSGQADGLVIIKLDRLTRNIADWQYLIDSYFGEKAGKQLFSVSDSVNTKTATGRMVLNMILTIAQWEREIIAERTKEALGFKIKNNERAGRLRYGYDLAPDGKTLVPNEREQKGIALMQELREEGWPLRAIAEELTRRGIRTKEGKPFSFSSVNYVLKSKSNLSDVA